MLSQINSTSQAYSRLAELRNAGCNEDNNTEYWCILVLWGSRIEWRYGMRSVDFNEAFKPNTIDLEIEELLA